MQNILVLRFSNGIFEPLWNRNYIDWVEIQRDRNPRRRKTGASTTKAPERMRDMIQNHLMQLMAFRRDGSRPPCSSRNRSATRSSKCSAPSAVTRRPKSGATCCGRNTPDAKSTGNMSRDTAKRKGRRSGLDDRDFRGDETLYRQLALGRRAVSVLYTGKRLDRKDSRKSSIHFKSTPDATVYGPMLRAVRATS